MDIFFSSQGEGGSFPLFSPPHLWAIGVILGINILMYYFRSHIKEENTRKYIRFSLSFLLIAQEIMFHLWNIKNGQWSVQYSLPLHLCGISTILTAVMLLNKSCRLYEILYFWGIGGALQAIITPEMGAYTFPHFRYFQFFLCHGAIITSCLFMTFIEGYRIRPKSMGNAFVLLNIYVAFVGVFNKITGSNYLFLCQKPYIASLMDYLGPWPWYIISLEVIAFLIFFLLSKVDNFCRSKCDNIHSTR